MRQSEDPFTRFEREGWERAAPKFEAAWSGLTRAFIPSLLDAVAVGPGDRLLDVACGPGYVAEEAHGRGAIARGLDFSAEMIRLARSRNPHLEFTQGDAQALDFEDHSFDVAVMNFAALHLAQPEAAFAEARRVLRPGGRYGFTVWAPPEHSPGARIVEEAVKTHADLDVGLPQGPDYFGYGDPQALKSILGSQGFDPESLGFETATVRWKVPTASFMFESERDAGVRTTALLAAQTPEALEAIRRDIEEGVQAFADGDGYAIPFAAHIISIKRPV